MRSFQSESTNGSRHTFMISHKTVFSYKFEEKCARHNFLISKTNLKEKGVGGHKPLISCAPMTYFQYQIYHSYSYHPSP